MAKTITMMQQHLNVNFRHRLTLVYVSSLETVCLTTVKY